MADDSTDREARDLDPTGAVLMMPFAAALLAPAAVRMLGGTGAGWLLAAVPALAFLDFAESIGEVASGSAVIGGFDWIPSFGVRFSWRIDGLSLAFALLISGIGTLILIYAGSYLHAHRQQGRFLSFMLLFMGSMQGLVLADSLLLLFVFWELTSITSFLLIGFDHGRERARRAALQALIVTGAGGLALLAAVLAIRGETGASELSDVLASGEALRGSGTYGAVLALVLAAAFTKSAQFPLHFWLPNAMEAPTPVSAYLHSATMVKAGVYLLMRLNPVLGGTAAWEFALQLAGGATVLAGAILALRQTDLKLMLAQTTVASLGLMVMLVGVGSEAALGAAVLYLLAHALFKGALFMVAGAIDHGAGSRDVTALGGLGRAMPFTFAAALLAACSMGGLPLLLGFGAKEAIYAGLLGPGWAGGIGLTVAIAGNAALFAIGFAVALKPFLGRRPAAFAHAHEAPVALWFGPAVLAGCGILAGLAAPFMAAALAAPMASAVAGRPLALEFSALPHLGWPLALSLVTILLGTAAYLALRHIRGTVDRLLAALRWGPDRGFDQFMRGLLRAAYRATLVTQSGSLVVYVSVAFCTVAATLLVPLLLFSDLPSWPGWPALRLHEWAVLAISALGLAAIVRTGDRLTAIVSLGIQGFAVALIFMLFGAPDLSYTQFMIETLSVVILALVMTRLRLSPLDRRPAVRRIADGALALACGSGFALLLMRIAELPFDDRLTHFFNEHSLVSAHGRNVVNVIIVDFRGFDTLGEISVVMTAGLAILALIRVRASEGAR